MSEIGKMSALSRVINSGSNKILFEEIKEQRKFDLEWIIKLEKWLPNIERATLNIRQAIKVEQEVVAIEKVKTVDSSSIRHLAANSNFVREISEDGQVTPSKLLTSFKVEDYGVYENRFLKTLINRLFKYVNVRYNSIQKNYESYLRRELEIDSDFKNKDEGVKIKISLSGKTNIDFIAGGESFEKIMERLSRIKMIVNSLKYSKFMKIVALEKEVFPPIVRTNAIMKNVDLVAAYNMWTFIDRETSLKFDIDHRATKLSVNTDFQNDIIEILSTLYRKYRFYSEEPKINRSAVEKLKKKKPKIIPGYSGKFVISDSEIKIENTQISEYYLQQITQNLTEKYKDIVTSGRSRLEAAKRVFRDLTEVADSVFDTMNLDQHPDSQDDCERLKYLEDKERVLSAYVDVKETNLRKYKRDLEYIQKQKTKLEEKVQKKLKQEKALILEKKAKEKKKKALELAKIAAQKARIQARIERAKQREFELEKIKKDKLQAKLDKQKAKELEKARLAQEKQAKAQEKEKVRLEKIAELNKAKEVAQKLLAKQKQEKELALALEKDKRKKLAAKEKERKEKLAADERLKAQQIKAKKALKVKKQKTEQLVLERAKKLKEKEKKAQQAAKIIEEEKSKQAKLKEKERAKQKKIKEEMLLKEKTRREKERQKIKKDTPLTQKKKTADEMTKE